MTYRSKRLGLFSGKGSSSRRAIYKGCGYDDFDLERPLIGIVNTANDAGLGHVHLDRLAARVRAGILQAGGTPFEFGTIATCGAVPIGMPHFRYELVIRDVIASSVEIMAGVQLLDGLVLLASCDSIIPGVLIGGIRSGLPCIMLAGGPQEVCKSGGRSVVMSELDQLVFGADYASGGVREKIRYLEDNVCPGPGACSLMGTANTMQILTEALGMALPGSATVPAVLAAKERYASQTGRRIMELVKEDVKPKDILTREALLNGIAVTMGLAGSTNAVLHLLSLAREVGAELTLDDFDRLSEAVPVISRVIPTGRATVVDLHNAGGVPAVLGELKEYLNRECMTVSGHTIGEIAEGQSSKDKSVLASAKEPVFKNGGIAVIKGNLSPNGAICRTTTISEKIRKFEGPARVFDSDEAAHKAVVSGEIKKGDIVVIRYEGPRGAPGMREMMMTTDALVGIGMGQDVFVLTDGRFSGFTEGAAIGHISPEAAAGGVIAAVRDGDRIKIDIDGRRADLMLPEAEIEKRLAEWKLPLKKSRGILGIYAKTALQAHLGAMIDDEVRDAEEVTGK
jgi:dihydroxy-acid dehydratase